MRVYVTRTVQQVVDGLEYKGKVGMGGVEFDFHVLLPIHLDKVDDSNPPESPEEARPLFPIEISKDGTSIELDIEEYGLFFEIISMPLVEFFFQNSTRVVNTEIARLAAEGKPGGSDIVLAESFNREIDFTPMSIEMLSRPKFGCQLASA